MKSEVHSMRTKAGTLSAALLVLVTLLCLYDGVQAQGFG